MFFFIFLIVASSKITNGQCRYNPSRKAATLRSIITIPSGDERKLAAAVAYGGPVSTSYDAHVQSFAFYKSGASLASVLPTVALTEVDGKGYQVESTFRLDPVTEQELLNVVNDLKGGFAQRGVYYDPSCSSNILDHAVLIIGYETDTNGNEYWLCKNSWSTAWGDVGYFKTARNRNNHCGIASHASYPVV